MGFQPPDGPPPPFGGDSPSGDSETSHRRLLTEAVRFSQLSIKDLWLHYFSIGGTAGEYEIDAYINASYLLPVVQHDILAQAVNEMIDMLPPSPRAPFSDRHNDSSAAEAEDR